MFRQKSEKGVGRSALSRDYPEAEHRLAYGASWGNQKSSDFVL